MEGSSICDIRTFRNKIHPIREQFIIFILIFLFTHSFLTALPVASSDKGNVRFELPVDNIVKTVTLAGDFNKWDKTSLKMVNINGAWQLNLNLAKGKYEYKFIADGDWDKLNKNNRTIICDKDPLPNVPVMGGEPKQRFISFQYTPAIKANTVALVGSFNDWKATANPMTENNGRWETSLMLEDGDYLYKFLVNGSQWMTDPNNPSSEADGYGGKNSVLKVGPATAKLDLQKGDGKIFKSAITFNPASPVFMDYYNGRLVLKIRVFANDVEKTSVSIDGKTVPLSLYTEDQVFSWFRIDLEAPQNKSAFYFILQDGPAKVYFTRSGALDKPDDNLFSFDKKILVPFEPPRWVSDAIFYQIFPDRFFNANASNDMKSFYPVQKRPAGKPWDIGDNTLEDWRSGKPAYGNYFGGDLQGIMDKLEYIRSLGINTIYLNPVFKSPSNHKYDTIDYMTIDPQFGSNGLFKKLVEKIHSLGMKVIIDGVFNHTADESLYFTDVARNGPKSRYYKWYTILKWPFPGGYPPKWGPGANEPKNYYKCWWDFGDMPKLNYDSREVRDFILKVGAFWIKDMGADGWRLDVPNEVPHDFWKEFRQAVKKANPQAYIVGEIWGNGDEWLRGDEFDAVMNYRFRDTLLDFFVKEKINAGKFSQIFSQYQTDYAEQVNAVQFNLLGSHDTVRYLTACGNDATKMKISVTFQMLYPGAPTVYYGDEIGLEGDKDPDNRRPFIWDESRWNRNIHDHYKKLIAIRDSNPLFRNGNFRPYRYDNDKNIAVFLHSSGSAAALSIYNNASSEGKIILDLKDIAASGKIMDILTDLISGKTFKVTGNKVEFVIPGKTGMVFIVKT
jgi:cyclomaltodextrinase / maltogenic alpha-amylase / neopullulanase